MGLLGNGSRLVVANVRVKSSDKHQRVLQQLIDFLSVGLNADHAVLVEGIASISQKSYRVEHVSDDHGLEDVQLKVSVGSSHRDGNVISNHLRADHSHSLTLGRVDFSGHDATSRLVFRQAQFSQAASGS